MESGNVMWPPHEVGTHHSQVTELLRSTTPAAPHGGFCIDANRITYVKLKILRKQAFDLTVCEQVMVLLWLPWRSCPKLEF